MIVPLEPSISATLHHLTRVTVCVSLSLSLENDQLHIIELVSSSSWWWWCSLPHSLPSIDDNQSLTIEEWRERGKKNKKNEQFFLLSLSNWLDELNGLNLSLESDQFSIELWVALSLSLASSSSSFCVFFISIFFLSLVWPIAEVTKSIQLRSQCTLYLCERVLKCQWLSLNEMTKKTCFVPAAAVGVSQFVYEIRCANGSPSLAMRLRLFYERTCCVCNDIKWTDAHITFYSSRVNLYLQLFLLLLASSSEFVTQVTLCLLLFPCYWLLPSRMHEWEVMPERKKTLLLQC